jgi:hypothetical protein
MTGMNITISNQAVKTALGEMRSHLEGGRRPWSYPAAGRPGCRTGGSWPGWNRTSVVTRFKPRRPADRATGHQSPHQVPPPAS